MQTSMDKFNNHTNLDLNKHVTLSEENLNYILKEIEYSSISCISWPNEKKPDEPIELVNKIDQQLTKNSHIDFHEDYQLMAENLQTIGN